MTNDQLMGSAHHFKQVFKYLDVPPGFVKVAAPGIEAVTAKQEAMRLRMRVQRLLDGLRKPGHVLRIINHRQPLAVLVRRDAVKSFQHLMALDPDAFAARSRDDIAPDR